MCFYRVSRGRNRFSRSRTRSKSGSPGRRGFDPKYISPNYLGRNPGRGRGLPTARRGSFRGGRGRRTVGRDSRSRSKSRSRTPNRNLGAKLQKKSDEKVEDKGKGKEK